MNAGVPHDTLTARPADVPLHFLDADGYVWREFTDGTISMARVNPDNSPIPEPRTYLMHTNGEDWARANQRIRDLAAEHETMRNALQEIVDTSSRLHDGGYLWFAQIAANALAAGSRVEDNQ